MGEKLRAAKVNLKIGQEFIAPKPKNFNGELTYFLVEKSNGSFRFVLILRKLNEFIVDDDFNMEDDRTATRLMYHGDFFTNIDPENA